MTLELHPETMRPGFSKVHVSGLPFPLSFHHITEPDHGLIHCHPFDFTSHILDGWYAERLHTYDPISQAWEWQDRVNVAGAARNFSADTRHEIIEVSPGGCYTLIKPGPHIRESRFWRFIDGVMHSRAWHEPENVWHRYDPKNPPA